jgi:hypothetical protein
MRLCPRGGEHSGADDRQNALADGHEQSGRTVPEVREAGGTRQPTQIGARPDEFVPFRANPQQQAFAKPQPVLTSAGISTARAGRSGGPRVIGSTGTCDNGASSVFLALVEPPKMLPIPHVTLADDEAGAG